MKNISVVGVGRLGLCFALTLEKAGYNVVGVDVNSEYVNALNNKSLKSPEQDVEQTLANSKNFVATTNLANALEHSDYIYVVVATPSLANGRYDHSQVDSLVEDLSVYGEQKQRKNLIICCTTMPEYCDTVADRLFDLNYTVSYNPEFIAQGTILRDQASPDMVLIGEDNPQVGDAIEEHYRNMTVNDPVVCRMSRTEAEITKISLNSFLTTKISFANTIGDIVKSAGYEPTKVLNAIGSDSRVGNKYLRYGFGYGGPCFPRDNRALSIYAKDKKVFALISMAADDCNALHLGHQVEEFVQNNSKEVPLTITEVTYKPGTTIIEESQQLLFAVRLASKGYKITIREQKEVVDQIKKAYPNIFNYEVTDE